MLVPEQWLGCSWRGGKGSEQASRTRCAVLLGSVNPPRAAPQSLIAFGANRELGGAAVEHRCVLIFGVARGGVVSLPKPAANLPSERQQTLPK